LLLTGWGSVAQRGYAAVQNFIVYSFIFIMPENELDKLFNASMVELKQIK